jgi:putative tryptophan/tyrosine transport system substrate-binding protein
MNRRELIVLIGGAAMLPVAARAQAAPVVGYLGSGSSERPLTVSSLAAFRRGLSETGYFEGRNVAIEYRWAEDHYDRLSGLAVDLARRQVAVIVALGALPIALAAKAATTTIPVVFGIGGDPVKLGLVTSLNRPDANLTGVTNLNTEVLPKRLELLHEVVPTATKIALLINPTNPAAETQLRDAQGAALSLGVQIDVVSASSEHEIDAAFANLAQLHAGGLVIAGDGVFVRRSEQLAALALRHEIPAIFQFRDFAAAGGLMSYGGSSTDQARLAGVYTGRILKGEKPADLPVQQYTGVELIINLKTAKAFGLTVPLALLTRADEVIE